MSQDTPQIVSQAGGENLPGLQVIADMAGGLRRYIFALSWRGSAHQRVTNNNVGDFYRYAIRATDGAGG